VIGAAAIHEPQLNQGGQDVDRARGDIGSPGGLDLHQSQQPGKDDQTHHSWDDPHHRLAQPDRGPEGLAAGDLDERRAEIDRQGRRRGRGGRHPWLANTRVVPFFRISRVWNAWARPAGAGIPGDPAGMPGTERPKASGRSRTSRTTSSDGTCPSIA